MFQTFKLSINGWKRTFICFKNGSGNTHVIDEDGNNYGAWHSKEHFLKNWKALNAGHKDAIPIESLGKVKLSFQCLD